MKDYEDIEHEQEQGIFRSRVLRAEAVRKRVNASRKFANGIRYSDEEILAVAANRIKLIEPARRDEHPWIALLGKWLSGARVDVIEVNGQELLLLMRLAGVKDENRIIPNHPYRVRCAYFKNLYLLALKRRAHV